MVFTPNHPLVADGKIVLYYGGFDVTHGADGSAAIGLATLRKDGFASLDARDAEGIVTTKKLSGTNGLLKVNYSARGGALRVEVLDEDGKPLKGYTRDDCDALGADSISQAVNWRDKRALPKKRAVIRLRFIMRNASLYSFSAGESAKIVKE